MIQKQFCGWLILATLISYTTAMVLRDTANATIGEPYILKFGYVGPKRGVTYHFNKDGKPLVAEKFRVFQHLGRLSFVEITHEDAGLYQFEVHGRRIQYSKAINLLGM